MSGLSMRARRRLRQHPTCGEGGGLYLQELKNGSVELRCFNRTHGGVTLLIFRDPPIKRQIRQQGVDRAASK